MPLPLCPSCQRGAHCRTPDVLTCFLQGLILNAPALGRNITFLDRALLSAVGLISAVAPAWRVVPGTPWENLCDEPDLIAGIQQDALYNNADMRAMTACTLGKVRRTRCLPCLSV